MKTKTLVSGKAIRAWITFRLKNQKLRETEVLAAIAQLQAKKPKYDPKDPETSTTLFRIWKRRHDALWLIKRGNHGKVMALKMMLNGAKTKWIAPFETVGFEPEWTNKPFVFEYREGLEPTDFSVEDES